MSHQQFCPGSIRISAAKSSVSTRAHSQRVRTDGGLSRRGFLVGVGGTIVGLAGAGARAAKPPSLTAYQDGSQVWVRLGNRILTSYRAHPSRKYPYFFPLAGPATGLSLTAETALPWPHHRSLFFACDHVNGANYWQGPVRRGQIVSSGPRIDDAQPGSVMIFDHCMWRVPGEPAMLTDERRFTIATAGTDRWSIDADLRLTAQTDVTVHKNNHSFFAIRAAPDVAPTGGGVLVNANGQRGEKATFGREAGWCDFSGPRRGRPEVVEGIALFDHPDNPWSPCRWFTRDYGFMSPTPFQWLDAAGWKLAAGKSIRLRYRVVVHTGNAAQADLAADYRHWAKK